MHICPRNKAFRMMTVILSLMLAFGTVLSSASANAGGAGDLNDSDPAASPIGPRNLIVTEVTHNTVSLAWDPAPGIAHYWIWNTDNKYILWANDGAQTVGGLEPETTYSFYVGPDGVQAPDLTPEQKSNVVTFTTLADESEYPDAPLTPPSFLKVTELTDNAVTLSWGASPNATGYDLYVNGGWGGGTWSNDATSITFEPEGGLEKGKTYVFEVGAQNPPHPVSKNSNKVTLVWGELAAPTDLQSISSTKTTAALGWSAVPGASSYDIYQNDQLIGSSANNRYTATGLTTGQTHNFAVVARNSQTESPRSQSTAIIPGSDYNIVTYYMSWAGSAEARNYQPTDIDVTQVTHINYAFADLCWKSFGTGPNKCQNEDVPLQKDYVFDGEMVVGDPELDLEYFRQFAEIKKQHPHLKIMISVGGWSWSKNFSNMAENEITRRAFANSVVKFLRAYELDGVDIDWEYPVEGGETHNVKRPEDKENFVLMAQTVREALDAAGSEDGKYYLQTIASGQGDNFVVNADLARSSAYLDFINIMTYDYSGNWEQLAHHNAPLFHDSRNPATRAERNHVLGGLTGHLNGGVPAHKLVMGIPFYGKGWQDCPPDGDGQFQTCSGGTTFGSWESSIFDYTDLEQNYVNKNGYVRHWNEWTKTAYLYNSEKQIFITYNDKASMMYAASLVKSLDIAGVMSWEITGDRNRTLTSQLLHDLPINGKSVGNALQAPTNLATSSIGENTIGIQWNASAGASGYEVYLDQKWVGYTKELSYTLDKLSSQSSYQIHVLAVNRTEDQILAVSERSNTIQATTLSGIVIPSSWLEGNKPALADGQLDTSNVKEGNKVTASVKSEQALQTIKKADTDHFFINLPEDAGQAEVIVPKAVLAALQEKGPQSVLLITLNDIRYAFRVHAWPLSTDVKISILTPDEQTIKQFEQYAENAGMSIITAPVEFKLEIAGELGKWNPVTEDAAQYVSRFFTQPVKKLNSAQATGVVLDARHGALRAVPTLFKADQGTITAELKSKMNSIYAIVETNPQFSDLTAAWVRNDAMTAAVKRFAAASEAGGFDGNHRMTRAELASMLVQALGILPASGAVSFTDIDPDASYAAEIEAAKQAGLIKGKSDHKFDPAGAVSRQEMAVMLRNALAYAGQSTQAQLTVLAPFADRSSIGGFAQAAVALMVQEKIMLGISATSIDPRSEVTKAQAAVAILRMLRAANLAD